MKGKMLLVMSVLLVISYFLYEAKGPNKNKKEKTEYISGKVTDINGQPISEATIYLLGSNFKSFTSNEGVYYIDAKIGDELIVSHPRYKKQSIEIKSKEENIELVSLKDDLRDKASKDFPNMQIE